MSDTTIRLSVTLDRETLDAAMRLTGSQTKRETIAKALDELVKTVRRRSLADTLGTGVLGRLKARSVDAAPAPKRRVKRAEAT